MKTIFWEMLVFLAMHHAVLSLYDTDRVETHKGVISALALINPHSLLFVDSTGANGTIEHWAIELPPAGQLAAQSLSRNVFVPGDSIEFCGYATRAGIDPMKSYQSPEPISLSLKSIPRPVYSGKLFFPAKVVLKQNRELSLSNDARCSTK